MRQAQGQAYRKAPAQHDGQVRPGLGERGPDLRPARPGDGEREHGVQEETRRRDRGHGQHQRDHDRPGQFVKRLPVQHVRLQVEHGGPDPHRRQHLDQGEPPVREQQLHPREQHGNGTDGQRERSQPAPGPAQLQDPGFDGRHIAVPDGADQLHGPGAQCCPPRPGCLGTRVGYGSGSVAGRGELAGGIVISWQRGRRFRCISFDGHGGCPSARVVRWAGPCQAGRDAAAMTGGASCAYPCVMRITLAK